MFYVVDKFEPGMLGVCGTVRFTRLQQHEARGVFDEQGDLWEVKRESPFVSGIIDKKVAHLVSNVLYTEVPVGKVASEKIELKKGDRGLVFVLRDEAYGVDVCDWLVLRALLDDKKIEIFYFEVVE